MNDDIFCRLLLVPQNNIMDLNNVMKEETIIVQLRRGREHNIMRPHISWGLGSMIGPPHLNRFPHSSAISHPPFLGFQAFRTLQRHLVRVLSRISRIERERWRYSSDDGMLVNWMSPPVFNCFWLLAGQEAPRNIGTKFRRPRGNRLRAVSVQLAIWGLHFLFVFWWYHHVALWWAMDFLRCVDRGLVYWKINRVKWGCPLCHSCTWITMFWSQ